MDATLGIAIGGLALGLGNTGWAIYTWRSSGPRVECESQFGFSYGPMGVGDNLLSITARNTGRAPIEVTQYGLRTPDNGIMVPTNPDPQFPRVPHTLNAGHEQSFLMVLEEIDRALAQTHSRGEHVVLRPYVKLGNGSLVYAEEREFSVP